MFDLMYCCHHIESPNNFFNTELHIFILSQGPQMMEPVLYRGLGKGMAGKAGALLGKGLECHLDICSADNEGSLKVFEYERHRVTVDLESHMRKRVQLD